MQVSGPIIAIGSGPYRKTLFDILKAVTSSDSSCMDIGNLQPVAPSYNVGSIVDVLARMGPNQNQPGGRARVSEAKDDKCTVTYVLDNRVERDLPAGLFSTPSDGPGNRRSSSSSLLSPVALSSSESRRVLELDRTHTEELEAKGRELEALRWEAKEASSKEKRRTAQLMEARELKNQLKILVLKTNDELEKQCRMRQIDIERMYKAVDQIADAAARAAAEYTEDAMS